MTPRQARRERREAERKAKKLELKRARHAAPPLPEIPDEYPEIQPRWNPELEDEFPREEQIRNNARADRRALQAGLPIPPSGPTPSPFSSFEEMRKHYLAKRNTSPVAPAAKLMDPVPEIGFVSQKRAEANRANSQLSTGPKTPHGKLASSRNSTKHGLASGQLIIPGEDPAEFDSLLAALLNDHEPAGVTEELLIHEMAQSHWLAQRAIRLQNGCFSESGVDEKGLSLFLRYFTTHNRAFHKALTDLQRLQKERRKAERGFVSKNAAQSAAGIGSVSQTAYNESPEDEFVRENAPSTGPETGFVSQIAPAEAPETQKDRAEAA